MLQTEGAAARHLHRTLTLVVLVLFGFLQLGSSLVLVSAAVGHEREGILHRQPRTVIGLVIVGFLGFVEVVRFRRVSPPGIEAHFIEVREVFPVDVACLRVERVIGKHALVTRPRVERQQRSNLLQFLIGLRPRAEACPDADHQVGIVLVHVFHHLLRTLQARLQSLGFVFGSHLLQVVRQVFLPSGVADLVYIIRIHEAHGVPV